MIMSRWRRRAVVHGRRWLAHNSMRGPQLAVELSILMMQLSEHHGLLTR